jgi:hypothetical protein
MEYHEIKQEQEKHKTEHKTEVGFPVEELKKQIAKVKRCFTSENSAYKTGYLSAMSVVEGMIDYLINGGIEDA